MHTMDMLGAFGALRVEVPLTTARVPAALEALEARKQYYLRKRAEVRALRVMSSRSLCGGHEACWYAAAGARL